MMPYATDLALVTLLLAAAALHAQPGGSPRTASAALPGRVVDVTAGEFFFQAPDSIRAGLTTFRLRQAGLIHRRAIAGGAARDSMVHDSGDDTRGLHMLWLVRLDSGKTVADFYRAVQAREPTPWARNLGGPGFAMPPLTSNATLVLEPGNYVLTCFVGSAREDRTRYHLLNGMFRPLTVLPSATSGEPMPTPDVTVRVSASGTPEYSTPILAGRRTLRIENAGTTGYEFSVRRVLPGRTMAEATTGRSRNGPTTPVPFVPIGGTSDVPPGGSLVTTIDFEPGEYFVAAGRSPFTVPPSRR